jgi:glycosyltransferase involved in cell wall biosynthesis
VVAHEPPSDPATAFPAGGIVVVPLRVASGVRMKILEAWARGVPVVATPTAGSGLDPAGWLAADAPAEWVDAIDRLTRDPTCVAGQVSAGRNALALQHAPAVVADRLIELYRRAARCEGEAGVRFG